MKNVARIKPNIVYYYFMALLQFQYVYCKVKLVLSEIEKYLNTRKRYSIDTIREMVEKALSKTA